MKNRLEKLTAADLRTINDIAPFPQRAIDARAPCMYDDGIVAADDTCLRCGAKAGKDCRDI